jgi:hypothetical protein
MGAPPAVYTIPVFLETEEAWRAWKYPDIKGFSALLCNCGRLARPPSAGIAGKVIQKHACCILGTLLHYIDPLIAIAE